MTNARHAVVRAVVDEYDQVRLSDLEDRQQLRVSHTPLAHIENEAEVEGERIVALHRPRVHVRRDRRTLRLTRRSQRYDETTRRGEDLPDSVHLPAEVGVGDVGDHDDAAGELNDTRHVGERVDHVRHEPLHLRLTPPAGTYPLRHGEREHARGRDEEREHVQPAADQPHLLVGQQTRDDAVEHGCGEGGLGAIWKDMSRNHLDGAQHGVQHAHLALRPVEALRLHGVDHPHGVQRVVPALHQRQHAVVQTCQENSAVGEESGIGTLREDLLNVLFFGRNVVGVSFAFLF